VSNPIICVLCAVTGSAELVSASVRDDSSGRFKIVRCLTCGHVQLFPLPSLDEEAAFYEADGQTRGLMGEVDFSLWQSKAAADTARRVNWLHSILPPGLGGVLDVGCGYGFFVDALARAGYQATGLDISRQRLALAAAHLHGTFIQGELDDAFIAAHRNCFHAVNLFHVMDTCTHRCPS
jgi:SAM-dependent methyltransferase